jgi:hypothetical protein
MAAPRTGRGLFFVRPLAHRVASIAASGEVQPQFKTA